MVRRWISILLLVVLTSGCGVSNVISNQDEVKTLHENKVHVIEFWNTYNNEENRILERELIPAFEHQFPHIKVISVRQAYSNVLKNTLFARAFSNKGPDVVRMHMDWVPDFYQNGLIMPLNEFSDFQNVADALNRKALSAGFYQNHYYSVPIDMYIQVAIYNRKLLNRAGYSEPPRTMDEVLTLARKKHYIIGLGGLDTWKTLPYIYSLGGSMTDAKFSKATGYLNGEATIRAVEKLLLLYKEGLIYRTVGEEGGDNWEGVKSGNVLITGEGPWFYSIWTGKELERALKWTFPKPFPYDKGPLPIVDGEQLVIMKGSKQKEAAWTFVKWMTSKEAQLKMSRLGLFPANSEAGKSMKVDHNAFVHSYQLALGNASLKPSVTNWSKIDEVYTLYMRKIFQGRIPPRDGLTLAAKKIDRLLLDHGSE